MGMRATRMTMKRMEEKKLKVSQSLIVYLFVLKMKFFLFCLGYYIMNKVFLQIRRNFF